MRLCPGLLFSLLLAPALVFSVLTTAEAQQAGKVYRIGYLALNSPPNPFYEAFTGGLRELGYVEGQNIVIESRWAEGRSERLPALAAELVRLRPDVIVTAAQAATAATKQATATVPIVMVNVKDPDREGFISSFARPGGNITGLTYTRAAVLINAAYPLMASEKQVMEEVARPLDIDLQWVPVQGPNEFEKAFAAMITNRAGAVVVFGDPLIFAHRRQVIALAEKNQLPAMYTDRVAVEDGGLMSYASDTKETYRRAAAYVDKILKARSRPIFPSSSRPSWSW